MNPAILAVLVIPLGIVLAYFLIKWKYRKTCEHVLATLQQHGVQGEIIPGFMPPLRLWLHNRKGDGWCRVRLPDGVMKWARYRNTLFSGPSVEFFD
ncbi:MAG: hypothetical protein JNM43_08795 [Planctomycetaceae bacterium]|nr:hypothetical protein [Planctomycetaceae bacterium]